MSYWDIRFVVIKLFGLCASISTQSDQKIQPFEYLLGLITGAIIQRRTLVPYGRYLIGIFQILFLHVYSCSVLKGVFT